jgi:hypothetical protein
MLFPEWDDTTVDDIWNGRAPAWQRDSSAAPAPSIAGIPAVTEAPALPVPADPRRSFAPQPPADRPAAPASSVPTAAPSAPPSQHPVAPPLVPAATAPKADAAPIDAGVAVPGPSRPSPRPPVSRLSKPLPPPRRPESLDPVVTSDLLTEIEETASLVEWLRAELTSTKAG